MVAGVTCGNVEAERQCKWVGSLDKKGKKGPEWRLSIMPLCEL